MNKNKLTTFAAFCGLFAGLTLLHTTVSAQSGTRTAPITVTNTTASPVPVTGGMTVANTPTVKLDPSANTVKIDPNSNVVQLAPQSEVLIGHREPYTSVVFHSWSGGAGFVSFPNINDGTTFTKARICVESGTLTSVTVVSWITQPFTYGFRIDKFDVPASATVCKLYDAPGTTVGVSLNTSNSVPGDATYVGFWGIY
jgi:hypothetical protein